MDPIYKSSELRDLAKQRDKIKDLTRELFTIRGGIELSIDPDRAICIKIALGGYDYLTHWVDVNSRVVDLLKEERDTLIQKIITANEKAN